jgi:hypothetical protein
MGAGMGGRSTIHSMLGMYDLETGPNNDSTLDLPPTQACAHPADEVAAITTHSRLPQPIIKLPHVEPTIHTKSRVKKARGIIMQLPVNASSTVVRDRLDTVVGEVKLRASCAMGWQQKRRVAVQAERMPQRLARWPLRRPVASSTSSAAAALGASTLM